VADDERVPRPAEAHFLVMLRQFYAKQDGRPPPQWRLALAVRRQAEQAALGIRPGGPGAPAGHPYSERVWAAVRAKVEAGDAERRLGEDLLFATDKSWHDQARLKLEAAKTHYADALKGAGRLRGELALRDQVLADLPFLTRWRAAQAPDYTRTSVAEEVWQAAHELARLLDEADPLVGNALDRAVKATRDTYQAWAEEYDRVCREEDHDRSKLPKNWRQVEQVLAAPLIEPELRVRLVEQSRAMSAKFNIEWAAGKKTAGQAEEVPARVRALQQGRLALAVLGEDLLKQQAKKDAGLLDQSALRSKLIDLPRDAWADSVTAGGAQVGRHWQALAAGGPADDPAAAERRSRLAVAFAAPDGVERAESNRWRNWRPLLVGLARRTGLDHWYGENPRDDRPYYRLVALRYLEDAKRLAGKAAAGQPVNTTLDVEDVYKLIADPKLNLFGPPEQIAWTKDQSGSLTYQLAVPTGAPIWGYAVFWADFGQGAVLRPTDPAALLRRPLELTKPAIPSLGLRSMSDDRDITLPVRMHIYFRGRALDRATTIRISRTSD
jgi:hypothetical protein